MRDIIKTAGVMLVLLGTVLATDTNLESCAKGGPQLQRYLLYDVNPGEGFNLRRDVYLRMANFVRKLNEINNWVLVLPPWGNLYHWKNSPWDSFLPWSNFFDVTSLNKWVPVIEFQQYLKEQNGKIDTVYVLQAYQEGWQGKWEEKYDERPCIDRHDFQQNGRGGWDVSIWGTELQALAFTCLSVQGHASALLPVFNQTEHSRSILLGRAETVLHDEYGGQWYWSARRSMRFATHLVEEATNFRREFLSSSDLQEGIAIKNDWRDQKPQRGVAVGGPYVAVHLRRRDFVHSRPDDVPTLQQAAKQIIKYLRGTRLNAVFIASDASREELLELEQLLGNYQAVSFKPSADFYGLWGDGGVAIVDQIICAHARYFSGSFESTFSFRIQEEREIMGFPADKTFNRLCGAKQKCEQPAKWTIVY